MEVQLFELALESLVGGRHSLGGLPHRTGDLSDPLGYPQPTAFGLLRTLIARFPERRSRQRTGDRLGSGPHIERVNLGRNTVQHRRERPDLVYIGLQ